MLMGSRDLRTTRLEIQQSIGAGVVARQKLDFDVAQCRPPCYNGGSWIDDAIVARISVRDRPASFSFAGPLVGPPGWSLSLRPGKSVWVGSVQSLDCL